MSTEILRFAQNDTLATERRADESGAAAGNVMPVSVRLARPRFAGRA